MAHSVGQPDRGIADLITYVLVPSRFACVSFAASALRQAERLVTAYTDFRTAFGKRLIEFPQVEGTVVEIRSARERTLASLFELLRLWEKAPAGEAEGAKARDFRVMLSLCKPILTRQATALLHEAIMLLGRNGIEERFSKLPRLFRDSVIMETWEGPHNVLFDQALRDLARFGTDPSAFVARVAGEARSDLTQQLAAILGAPADPGVASRFRCLAETLVHAFGERSLADAG